MLVVEVRFFLGEVASAALAGWRRPGRAASPLFFSTLFSPSAGAIHARVGAGFMTKREGLSD
ncbi:hypothetical protein, partial [Frankia sp. CIT1]|uniref:hypothetical protein n=1 Tax=Frankia sp. CIT1 TaxID=2880974 RepID=UPI001EF41163